jgi:hypothetical protein
MRCCGQMLRSMQLTSHVLQEQLTEANTKKCNARCIDTNSRNKFVAYYCRDYSFASTIRTLTHNVSMFTQLRDFSCQCTVGHPSLPTAALLNYYGEWFLLFKNFIQCRVALRQLNCESDSVWCGVATPWKVRVKVLKWRPLLR